MEIFTLGEVAKILQIPISRIKNWSVGRPFKIVPRIRAAIGKGSRNLYSLEDVYLIALVNQLHLDGVSNRAIANTLEQVFLAPKLGSVQSFSLWREGDKWATRFFTRPVRYQNIEGGARPKRKTFSGVYSLDIAALIGWVNSRVTKLKGRS